MTKVLEKCREKIVEEFNSQFPADTMIYDSDGESAQDSLGKDIRINSNWIVNTCVLFMKEPLCKESKNI